ncbi:MAG TPA: pyridoxamine 5'-phosphate oxidase family protein, partial [Ilumatobacteraceae bacterium]
MTDPDTTGEYVDSYEDVSVFALDDEREQALHDAQTECTFMWTTSDGDPVGVIMNYLLHDGRFWLTCTRRRKRVAAIEARPRVAIAVSSRGTDIGVSQAVTYKGDATVHESQD